MPRHRRNTEAWPYVLVEHRYKILRPNNAEMFMTTLPIVYSQGLC